MRRTSSPLVFVFLALALCTLPTLVAARSATIAALSVDEETHTGSVAEMSLEIRPGSGSVYIESSPLTRLDTQMSARMARSNACKLSSVDCERYDFFYVIHTPSSVIGGPSAGGALAVLTYAVLEDIPLRNDTAMTGAILSGGIIGPVGRVPEKVTGAAANGFSRVAVPSWEAWTEPSATILDARSRTADSQVPLVSYSNESYNNTTNNTSEPIAVPYPRTPSITDDTARYGIPSTDDNSNQPAASREYTTTASGRIVTVIPVATLGDAIEAFTGTRPRSPPTLTAAPEQYTNGMKQVSALLCDRSVLLDQVVEAIPANALYADFIATESSEENRDAAARPGSNATIRSAPWRSIASLREQSDEQYARSQVAHANGEYYTAASQCFGTNLQREEITLRADDRASRQTVLANIKRGAQGIREAIDKADFTTISDLEITMIASERLSDVEQELESISSADPDPRSLAYASERLETARAWLTLLGKIDGAPLTLSDDELFARCRSKLDEAQERVNYVSILYDDAATELQISLGEAFNAAQRGQSALCLLEASQAKAEANAVLSAVYVPEEVFPRVLEAKRAAARDAVAVMADRGTFPILGYSYLEYADELVPRDNATAALYAEYSLELANLPIYFPHERSRLQVDTDGLVIFGIGAIFGILLCLVVSYFIQSRQDKSGARSTIAKPQQHRTQRSRKSH